jgi:hypothetical protein
MLKVTGLEQSFLPQVLGLNLLEEQAGETDMFCMF